MHEIFIELIGEKEEARSPDFSAGWSESSQEVGPTCEFGEPH